MFLSAEAFNSELAWDTSSVTTMESTFKDATAFNSQLDWDTSKVTNMDRTFRNNAFNQPLDWDTSSLICTDTRQAESFNQPLDWDTSKVTCMGSDVFRRTVLRPGARLGYERGDEDGQHVHQRQGLQLGAHLGHDSVTDMWNTFNNARAFNSPLVWDTSGRR